MGIVGRDILVRPCIWIGLFKYKSTKIWREEELQFQVQVPLELRRRWLVGLNRRLTLRSGCVKESAWLLKTPIQRISLRFPNKCKEPFPLANYSITFRKLFDLHTRWQYHISLNRVILGPCNYTEGLKRVRCASALKSTVELTLRHHQQKDHSRVNHQDLKAN